MPLYQIDKVQTPFRDKFGIVNENEVSGVRSVATMEELFRIPDAILSPTKTGDNNDAIGQEWYVVAEGRKYRLVDWTSKDSDAGWKMTDPIELINSITIGTVVGVDKVSVELPTSSQSTKDNSVQTRKQIVDLITDSIKDKADSEDITDLEKLIDTKLSTVYKFKGSVANNAALQEVKEPANGDVYNVETDGMNYAWVANENEANGGHWDALGAIAEVDLSGYQTLLTFDNTPTEGSSNPVKSSGIKTYVDNRVDNLAIDISENYVDKSSAQLITGVKTFTTLNVKTLNVENNISAKSLAVDDLSISGTTTFDAIPVVNITEESGNITQSRLALYDELPEEVVINNASFDVAGIAKLGVSGKVTAPNTTTLPNNVAGVGVDTNQRLIVSAATNAKHGVVKLTADSDVVTSNASDSTVLSVGSTNDLIQKALNELIGDTKPLVSPVITGSWTFSPSTPSGVNASAASITIERGYTANWNGSWKWTASDSYKNPTQCVSFGEEIAVPNSGVSTSISISNATTDTTKSVVLKAPKPGLIVSNGNVIKNSSGQMDSTTKSISVKFKYRSYWGFSESETITNNVITELENSELKDNFVLELEGVKSPNTSSYFYYCYPAAFGEELNEILVGGQASKGGFTKSTFTMTNAAEAQIPMIVYRSNNSGVPNESTTMRFA